MNKFKTPEEAIAACDASCAAAWLMFSNTNHIKKDIDAVAYNIANKVFRSGYMCGARYVSELIVNNLSKHTEEKSSSVTP